MSMRGISIDRMCFDLYRAMFNRPTNIPRALRQLPILFLPALVIASSAATAQGYPNKPIHIIVPYAAGGAIDATARILAAFRAVAAANIDY